jgi:hypothetical protein
MVKWGWRIPVAESKLITVYWSQGMLGAQVVKAKLESAGVPVLLKYESVGQVIGLTVDGLGRVEVQVPAAWADDARDLLTEEDPDEVPGLESPDD